NYVYIPLGGNRHGLTKTCINLMIVFAITGFWHGAQWTFILWGMWHGVFIVIEKLTHFPKLKGNLLLMTSKHLFTLFIVLIGWVLFRAEQFDVAYDYLKNMFGLIEHSDSMYGNQYFYDNIQLIALFFAIVFTMPWLRTLCNKLQGNIAFTTVYNLALIGIFLLCSIFLTASTYNPFIYFRF
ncbi:MAG: MBOAT family O-acyltransferase, partial [Succinivibrio sp.]|nr:MBOAT family O-acyltransferase [Succinivibrio sp.]